MPVLVVSQQQVRLLPPELPVAKQPKCIQGRGSRDRHASKWSRPEKYMLRYRSYQVLPRCVYPFGLTYLQKSTARGNVLPLSTASPKEVLNSKDAARYGQTNSLIGG